MKGSLFRAAAGGGLGFRFRSWPGVAMHVGILGRQIGLDAKTGQVYWVHDMLAAVWGSPLVVDGKVYLGDEDGDVVVLQAGKVKKQISEMNMGSSVYSSPVPANGALFIMNRNQLFALAEKPAAAPAGVKPASN